MLLIRASHKARGSLRSDTELVVAMSGETDYISNGSLCFTIKNGSFWQEKITGSGCMASACVQFSPQFDDVRTGKAEMFLSGEQRRRSLRRLAAQVGSFDRCRCRVRSLSQSFSHSLSIPLTFAAHCRLLAINVAAEIAAARPEVNGPNTFRAALIDACYNLRPEDVRSRAKIQRV